MNQNNGAATANGAVCRLKATLRSSLSALASVKFAVTVVLLIVLACVVGTLLPQGNEVAAFLQKYPGASRRMEIFGRLGLTQVFSAWWFIALLTTLAASVASCSRRRFATLRVASGAPRVRALGSMLTHLSILLILAGGVIRGLWGEKGQLELRTGQTKNEFQIGKGFAALPFAVQLANFEIQTYDAAKPVADTHSASEGAASDECSNQLVVQWPERNLTARLPVKLDSEQVLAPKDEPATATNSFRLKILRYVPDFTIDTTSREVSTRSSEPNNPAILLAVNGPDYENQFWLFAKYPEFGMHGASGKTSKSLPLRLRYDNHAAAKPRPAISGPIKSFRSTLKIIESGQAVATRQVEVNSPFRYRGYTFYQSGYNPQDLSWTSLQVVRDPGVPVVYAGFALMIGGLFVVFYLTPWLQGRNAGAPVRVSTVLSVPSVTSSPSGVERNGVKRPPLGATHAPQ